MTTFRAIAAMAENRVIGAGNTIPWHLPEDFQWFKRTTMGHVLVMGRRTYESIGRPLPGRETLVLSRTAQPLAGVRVIHSLDEIGPLAAGREVFICGGAQVYVLALQRCAELLLTRVKRTVEGDVLFPPFEHLFAEKETVLENADFRIVRYLRRGAA
jgi:dihydrofolate reductase